LLDRKGALPFFRRHGAEAFAIQNDTSNRKPGKEMTVLREDLEAAPTERGFGSGWISGVLALMLSLLGLGAVLCLRYPDLLTLSAARSMYNVGLIRLAVLIVLMAGFLLGIVSIILRKQKILGFTALATALGGSEPTPAPHRRLSWTGLVPPQFAFHRHRLHSH